VRHEKGGCLGSQVERGEEMGRDWGCRIDMIWTSTRGPVPEAHGNTLQHEIPSEVTAFGGVRMRDTEVITRFLDCSRNF
jgi:hypothetical protein